MRIIYLGTPKWAIFPLEGLIQSGVDLPLIITQPDRPVGRKREFQASPVKEYALKQGLSVFAPEKIRQPDVLQKISEFSPDALIVCAYGQLLPQALLDLPRWGCFNLHFSKLPRWRGASPVQAAIRYGDVTTGVSLQRMKMKLDSGPLLAESEDLTICSEDTYESLGERLAIVSKDLLCKNLDNLSRLDLLREQDESQVTHCRIIKKEEGQVFWHIESALEIERKLRAFTPWPGIFTSLDNGQRLQLLKLKVLEERLPIGQISTNFMVGCREGSLKILELKPEGKGVMSAEAFLRGKSQFLGTNLT